MHYLACIPICFSHVSLFTRSMDYMPEAPLSLRNLRKGGLPSTQDLPSPGIEPLFFHLLPLAGGFTSATRKPQVPSYMLGKLDFKFFFLIGYKIVHPFLYCVAFRGSKWAKVYFHGPLMSYSLLGPSKVLERS